MPAVEWGPLTTEQLYERYSEDVAATTIMELQRAAALETTTTKQIVAAIPRGSRLHGLEYRMKSPSSLAAKIDTKLRLAATRPGADASAPAIAAKLTDLIRYTVVSRNADHVIADMRSTLISLSAQGWHIRELEHTFSTGNPYKGIHALLARSAGDDEHVIELQFHSEDAISLKDRFHGDYEVMRDPSLPATERAAAFERMASAWEDIPTSPGLTDFTFGGISISARMPYRPPPMGWPSKLR